MYHAVLCTDNLTSGPKGKIMEYMLIAMESPEAFEIRKDPKRHQAYLASWKAYTETLIAAGVMVGGNGLEPANTSTTLRVRDGKRQVQDGPYADTKEQLGGYYIINVPDLDTALDWASRVPCAATGAVEVRPVLTYKQPA
jgi:hypothetical protein